MTARRRGRLRQHWEIKFLRQNSEIFITRLFEGDMGERYVNLDMRRLCKKPPHVQLVKNSQSFSRPQTRNQYYPFLPRHVRGRKHFYAE